MKQGLLAGFCLLLWNCLPAQQSYIHQILFLNEGRYDFAGDSLVIPPSVGAYDPIAETYTVFDEIPEADFASDIIVDDKIYVAADNLLITYDKNTLTRLQTATIPGVRKLAIWKDQLLVTRGDYGILFDSYFQVYDKNTLQLLYALDTSDGPKYAAEGMVVRNDTAFVAINNGFDFNNEVGVIGIVDLTHQVYAGELDLGPAGINPDNIMTDGNHIYTLNNKDYQSSSISIIDPVTEDVSTYDMIAANSGCGTSTLAAGRIYYMEYNVGKLARFDVQSLHVVDTLSETGAYYGLIDDVVDGHLIGTWTDFVSHGIAYILDYDGSVLTSFDVGVSPGSIALDIRSTTAATHEISDNISTLYPNPVSHVLTISTGQAVDAIKVFSATGRLLDVVHAVPQHESIGMDGYPAGLYIVQVTYSNGMSGTYKVVKE